MELPHLGDHCSDPTCKKLDFLPVKCDGCKKVFCNDHYSYANHSCPYAYKHNIQVPVCPLCNKPVPVPRGEPPDLAVSAHIDRDCQADPAKSRRKVFANRCTHKGCKVKEIVPVVCKECGRNFCLKHRHTADHQCQGKHAARNGPVIRQGQTNSRVSISTLQGSMDEDEALARALALSIQDSSNKKHLTQEELDEALARQLQQQEQGSTGPSRHHTPGRHDRCHIS